VKREKSPPPEPLSDDPLWFKDAIIYQVHVKAFFDSNEDGYGDFAGITAKLDYIQALGVNTVWLLPFYPSPLKDDGYDIASYEEIHETYGLVEHFKTFLREAHARGLRVVTELVINHTSDQHPWFQRARSAPKGSPERDFYVWSDDPNRYPDARIIFTDTEKSNWAWDPVAQQFYWHRFFSHQPDLNFDNPKVVDAVINVMRFWLKMGVDGLRLDAIPYLVEREGTNCENLPDTHVVLKQLRAVLDQEYPNRVFLAEANQWPADVRPYFGDGDECHMAFHFPLMPRMFMAVRREDRTPIVEIMSRTPTIPDTCQWAIFLRNHDELTLEMVTDEERDYMYREYARDRRMRINIGIRRRLAPLMENGRRQIELMSALLMSMPGTPIVYYGDEIGMGDNIYLGDRNGVRTPMQWSDDKNAGFSQADAAALYSPVIVDPPYGYHSINVEAQEKTPTSLLRWMRRCIGVRKAQKAFGRGTQEFLHPENKRVLVFLRRHEREIILCVNNLSRYAQPVELDLTEFAGLIPVELWSCEPFPPIGQLPYFFTMGPHAFLWFRLVRPDEVAGMRRPDAR
jgi:maltose alpha-D-glucosyltransferase / alpha-amylase